MSHIQSNIICYVNTQIPIEASVPFLIHRSPQQHCPRGPALPPILRGPTASGHRYHKHSRI